MSDTKPVLKNALLTACSLATVIADATFTDAKSGLNHNPLKREGGLVLANTETVNWMLMISHGPEAKSPWSTPNGSTTLITPTGTFDVRAGSDVKPKVKQPVLVDSALTVINKADLLDMSHPVNQDHVSGKKKYSLALMRETGKYTVVYANGSEPSSTWMVATTGVSVGAMTGTAPTYDGHKPKAFNPIVLGNGYPTVTLEVMSDIDSALNAGDGTAVNFKRTGSIVSVYQASDGAYQGLYTPVGSSPASGWRPVLEVGVADANDVVPA